MISARDSGIGRLVDPLLFLAGSNDSRGAGTRINIDKEIYRFRQLFRIAYCGPTRGKSDGYPESIGY